MKANLPLATLPQLIDRFQAAAINTNGQTLDPLILLAYHSTAIDGAGLTLPQTKTLIQTGNLLDDHRQTDQLMIIDYHYTLGQILTMATHHEPLSQLTCQQLAANLMRQTGGPLHSLLSTIDTRKGELRIDNALAGRGGLVGAHKLPVALAELLKDINTRINQLKTPRQLYDLSFQAHFHLLSLHPFGAGNGRMARLLMSYIQQYHGVPLSFVYADQSRLYFDAIEASWRQKTSVPIVSFLHSQLSRYLEEVIER
ncbi:Fic family protein [Spirosoma pollinicola]|uniref:Filamentation induced by cAMP protein fic n=1 Tax=Spirosoma pollinicola TaxID=2057025 RepID=A0A2K8ZAR8_9BACT|nr:Fic family protein [Spirosoma pollinicola]AUD06963.1 filamentation induced by cAMP protein fic [Spirosoma pollinicola]